MLEDIIKLDVLGNFINTQWIEITHGLVPNKPDWYRQFIRNILAFFGHCKECTILDGCYFLETKSPELPIHDRCDCIGKNIPISLVIRNAISFCPIEKFTLYIFGGIEQSKGKQKIFEDFGFSKDNAEQLKNIIEEQAKNNYISGNYFLKLRDDFGQRISIPIDIKGNQFYTGWMVYPDGLIKNTTPFGGWVK